MTIPYLYVGLFDGHGGAGAAVKISKELHSMLHEGLEDVLPYMTNPDKQKREEEEAQKTAAEEFDEFGDDDETVEVKMDIDELVCGALESSFWAMDRLILRDKENYRYRPYSHNFIYMHGTYAVYRL